MNTRHVPILVEPIVQSLCEPFLSAPLEETPLLVDATFGGGGHTSALLNALEKSGVAHRIVGLDQDQGAIERGRVRFEKEIQENRLELHHCRFGEAEALLQGRPILGLLADLGFSSDQMDTHERGLSFHSEGPLDMRLNPDLGESCEDYLKQVSEEELEQVLREFGQERFSRKIAKAIIDARQKRFLPQTPKELSHLIIRAMPSFARHGRIHAATRSFQALRIQVNDEMGELKRLLDRVIMLVKPGGRVAIMSFHSLEDRQVKVRFKDRQGGFTPLFKKPLMASEEEMKENPRSRSAKLRIAVRS